MPGPFTLIIETSTPRASIAVATLDGNIRQHEFTGDRSHNSALFAPLAELLEKHRPNLPGLVITGSGPGSYSGTRVGIAAAQGVAIAAGCGVAAVPSILAVDAVKDGRVGLAIGDARRGSFWTARVNTGDGAETPVLTDFKGLENAVARALAAGVPVFTFEDPDRFPLPAEMRRCITLQFPEAGRLWKAWERSTIESQARWTTPCPEPIYLKPPHITPAKNGKVASAAH